MTDLTDLHLPSEEYVELLRKMMDNAEKLQNNPAMDLVPEEDLASDHVMEYLGPYLKAICTVHQIVTHRTRSGEWRPPRG